MEKHPQFQLAFESTVHKKILPKIWLQKRQKIVTDGNAIQSRDNLQKCKEDGLKIRRGFNMLL